jgi:hypothetical protein
VSEWHPVRFLSLGPSWPKRQPDLRDWRPILGSARR